MELDLAFIIKYKIDIAWYEGGVAVGLRYDVNNGLATYNENRIGDESNHNLLLRALRRVYNYIEENKEFVSQLGYYDE